MSEAAARTSPATRMAGPKMRPAKVTKSAKAAGIDAIEIHQHVFEKTLNGEIDWPALERARDGYLAELGLTVPACNINTWTNPRFRLGGPCNPDAGLRRAALEEILKAVEICQALNIPVLSVWPGSDGADYHFQIDYRQSLEWFTEALVAANEACMAAGIVENAVNGAVALACGEHVDG